jgi:hypothetical protein
MAMARAIRAIRVQEAMKLTKKNKNKNAWLERILWLVFLWPHRVLGAADTKKATEELYGVPLSIW